MADKDLTFLNDVKLKTADYLRRINIAISRELERQANSRFYRPLRYALEGGKRIRPLAVLLSAETVGSTDDSVLDAAVAVELLHAESIIHDDIIDQEVARRGKAAFHIKYGYTASLLTADFVFSMILAIAARYQDKRVANAISTAALRMCEGEYAELTIDPLVYNLDWKEYTDIIYNKTASLFQTATKLGGLVGNGGKEQIEALSNYGKYLGIAYQIHDDLLDWGAKDKITAALRQRRDESSVLSELKRLEDNYAIRAKGALEELPESNARRLLVELTDFSLQREL